MDLLQQIIDILAILAPLPDKNKDHPLKGNYIKKRECHLMPNWLLIYRIENNRLILYRPAHIQIYLTSKINRKLPITFGSKRRYKKITEGQQTIEWTDEII